MRRVIAALAMTAAVVVAVLLYRSPPVRTTSSPAPGPSPLPTPSGGEQAFTGPVVEAHQRKIGYIFGEVQVVVIVEHGRVVAIRTPLLPPAGDTGGRGTRPTTASITQFAVPILKQEAARAQSANIQSVSGATFTSEAFMRSLQAALLQAQR